MRLRARGQRGKRGTTTDRANNTKGEAMDSQDAFTTDTTGLPEASSPSVVRLQDGDSLDLDIRPVRKKIGDAEVRMLGYNGSIPGPGLYWYHPHIREDYAQEMGLYAPIVVESSDPSYWPLADRQLTITLDDVLIEGGKMAPFSHSGLNFVAMGRFGNVMLINGQTHFSGEATVGEVVRLYLVNTANTRLFKFVLR